MPATFTPPPTKIMLIRHAEKPPDSGKPHGVLFDGDMDVEALTVRGWQRAGALVQLFAPTSGQQLVSVARQ